MKIDDQSQWETHVAALGASGLSRAAYCRKHSLNYGQMIRWQGQLAKGARRKRAPQAFVKAAVASVAPVAVSDARLTIGSAAIEFSTSADPRWIAALALAIGGQTR